MTGGDGELRAFGSFGHAIQRQLTRVSIGDGRILAEGVVAIDLRARARHHRWVRERTRDGGGGGFPAARRFGGGFGARRSNDGVRVSTRGLGHGADAASVERDERLLEGEDALGLTDGGRESAPRGGGSRDVVREGGDAAVFDARVRRGVPEETNQRLALGRRRKVRALGVAHLRRERGKSKRVRSA